MVEGLLRLAVLAVLLIAAIAVGLACAGPFGAIVGLAVVFAIALLSDGRRGEGERKRREPGWSTYAAILLGLVAFMGYIKMVEKGYADPRQLLQDVAPSASR